MLVSTCDALTHRAAFRLLRINEAKVAVLEEMPPMAKITTSCQQLLWWVVLDLQRRQRPCVSHNNSYYIVVILSAVSDVSGTLWGGFCAMLFPPLLGRGREIPSSALIQTFDVWLDVLEYSAVIRVRRTWLRGRLLTWISAFSKWKNCFFFVKSFQTNFVKTFTMKSTFFTVHIQNMELTVPSCGWVRPWGLCFHCQKKTVKNCKKFQPFV